MTPLQFEVLAQLLRSRSASREACRRVLVLGQRQCDVAREMDVSPMLIARALKPYRTAERKIVDAFVTSE